MDGAAIAATDPRRERAPLTAPPLRVDSLSEPFRASYVEPRAAVQQAQYASPAPREPELSYDPPVVAAPPAPEPAPVATYRHDEEQGDLLSTPAAAPVPAPQAVAPAPQITRPITRIVDPAVAEAEDEPLFPSHAYDDRRQQRGGFMSLFSGRPRYDAPPPAPRAQPARGGAQPEPMPEEHISDQQDDLEIPSFLRRLAN
ncbi:MAG: cell division protein FtsZ, partial [Phenylobacterium sp.]|nr:cell division protein FtsZ [Phenylobacterium sp.]